MPCGAGLQALAERDRDLVVDPAMARIPDPGIEILGRDVQTSAGQSASRKYCMPPRIGFADRHWSLYQATVILRRSAHPSCAEPRRMNGPAVALRGAPLEGRGAHLRVTDVCHRSLLRRNTQRKHRKIFLRVGPHRGTASSRSRAPARRTTHRVLVAVLGVDGLAGAEFDRLAADAAPSGASRLARCISMRERSRL